MTNVIFFLNWIYSLPESEMNFPVIYLKKKKGGDGEGERRNLCLPSTGMNLPEM